MFYGLVGVVSLVVQLLPLLNRLVDDCRATVPAVTDRATSDAECVAPIDPPFLMVTITAALLILCAAMWTSSQHRVKRAVAAVGIFVGLLLSIYGLGPSLAFVEYFGPSPWLVAIAGASVIGVAAALVLTREWLRSGLGASGRAGGRP